jgi:hypothetical protein
LSGAPRSGHDGRAACGRKKGQIEGICFSTLKGQMLGLQIEYDGT